MRFQALKTPFLTCTFLTLLVACDRALVYGDRTGVNIAIKSDVAEGSPIEANAGLQRRVFSFVPPRGETADAKSEGDAVNMLGRFDLKRSEGEQGIFSDKVRIRTSFASGAAARTASTREDAVATITKAPNFTLTNDPVVRSVTAKLLDFVSLSDVNLQAYLALAEVEGVDLTTGSTDRARAVGGITNPKNTAANKRIVKKLTQ